MTSGRQTTSRDDALNPLQYLSEAQVRDAVTVANIPVLLMVVFQVTGDEKWLSDPYLPTRAQGLGDHDSGGLSDALQKEICSEAVRSILSLQAGDPPAVALPGPELAVRMMRVFVGEPVPERYGPMIATELTRRVKPDAPEITPEQIEVPPNFSVVVIGAGISGIIAAQQLEDMGAKYVVLEKQAAPGGNWWQNVYPGAGVDTPSHLYSFFFAQNDWQRHFELRDALQAYFSRVADEVSGADRIRYGTEVRRAEYVAEDQLWHLEVCNPDGSTENLTANVVVSAVGVLNRPKVPPIQGRDSFKGPSFHSSAWPAGLSLKGKRVALVGTGASAMQIGCSIADEVSELVIFQRSPQWVAPFEKFNQSIPDELRGLLRTCPLYHGWYWLRLFWQFGDRVIEALRVDPDWPHLDRAVNRQNDGQRAFFTRYLQQQLEGREDLVDRVLPDYPPFGKRILLDHGWYDMLKLDHVTLVNEAVSELHESSIVSTSGLEHEVDVVVWATGFDVARFVGSFEVIGASGVSLRVAWEDVNPRAYLGVSVPGFPNFFMLGGPNSFPGSGSFMFFMEVQMRYIRRLLTAMIKKQVAAIEVRDDVNFEFNDRVDSLHRQLVWTHRGMSTWFRNRHHRVVFLMPFLNVDYWNMTARADLENYLLHPAVETGLTSRSQAT